MISDVPLSTFISSGLDIKFVIKLHKKRYKPSLNTYITGLMKVVIMNLSMPKQYKLFKYKSTKKIKN